MDDSFISNIDPDAPEASPEARAERLKQAREGLRLKRAEFARRHGISSRSIQNWELALHNGLTVNGAKKLVEAFQAEGLPCTFEWLYYGRGPSPETQLFHGPHISSTDEKPHGEQLAIQQELRLFHKLNSNATDMIVPNDAMQPLYYKGDIVAGRRVYGDEIKNTIEQPCIINTEEGFNLIGYLHPGRSEGLFTVSSSDTLDDSNTIIAKDVKLFSIAPILWIRRRSSR